MSTEEIYKGKTVLAFVIDNEVVDTFLCEDRMAAILQSSPKVIDITKKHSYITGPHKGWIYDGQEFYPPQEEYN